MSPADGWETLFARRTLGVRLGLSIVQGVYDAMGRPGRSIPAVHIVGTNGKGSTAAMVEHGLRRRGWSTGLYTSPHLHRVGERVRIGGEAVSDDRLRARVERVLAAERGVALARPLSFFELLTLAALDELAAAAVDVLVIEAGLGGRLDATRLVEARVVAVSPIALDHQAMLGPTLAAIAGEKAAVMRPGVPTVSAPQAPEAAAVLRAHAAVVGSPLHWAEPLPRAPAGLRGDHQRVNAGLAVAAATVLEPSLVAEDLDGVRWPGRLETIAWAGGTLVLDVGHNPAGIEATVDAVLAGAVPRPDLVIFGCQGDKDATGMRHALDRLHAPRWWVSPTPDALGPSPDEPPEPHRFSAPDAALASALAAALRGGQVALVCGSHLLVAAVRAWGRGLERPPDPQDPRPLAR